MQLEGKVALITGGGSGIGAALARRFVAEGATVCITGRRAREARGGRGVAAGGQQRQTIVGDVRDQGDTRRMVDEALSLSGRLDVLVNNAAANLAGTVVDMDLATWQEMLDTNLTRDVPAHEGGDPADDRGRRRLDHQHGLACRRPSACRARPATARPRPGSST